MRYVLFHTHLHHDDLERRLLILYLLVFDVVLIWGAWNVLTALSDWGNLIKPEIIQFWPY